MFFLPASRFSLIRLYHEDPTGTTFVSYGRRAHLFRFLTLLFYSFLYTNSSLMPFAFTTFKKPYWSWVYKNKHKVMQWDALRRYNYKFVKRLKATLYKKRLLEYKKLKYFYFSLRDYQFRKFALKGIPLYTRFKSHFLSFLELRLLTFCVRLGIFDTHIQGRQELRHFGITVDNKRIYYTNYVLRVGAVLSLSDFDGFHNFGVGFDSWRYPVFRKFNVKSVHKTSRFKSFLSHTLRNLGILKLKFEKRNLRSSYFRNKKFSSKVRGSGTCKRKRLLLFKYRVLRKYRKVLRRFSFFHFNFINKINFKWLKLFEYFVFRSKRLFNIQRFSHKVKQGYQRFTNSKLGRSDKMGGGKHLNKRKKFNKLKTSNKFPSHHRSVNPIIYDRQFESRAYSFSILKSNFDSVPRQIKFDRALPALFFSSYGKFRVFFQRKIFLRTRRKIFRLRPKPYMLISWALKKLYLVRAPSLGDVEFPFLADPVLGLSFISNR